MLSSILGSHRQDARTEPAGMSHPWLAQDERQAGFDRDGDVLSTGPFEDHRDL